MKATSHFITYDDIYGHDEDALLARSRNPAYGAHSMLSGLLQTNLYSLYGYMQRNSAHPFTAVFLEATQASPYSAEKAEPRLAPEPYKDYNKGWATGLFLLLPFITLLKRAAML